MQNNITQDILNYFYSTIRSFKHKLDYSNPIFHLPIAQMEALRIIGEKKKILMKEVADLMSVTPPSATSLINSLSEQGLVERSSDKNDRRTVHLTLTKHGADILQKGIKERCGQLQKLLKNLSLKEQKTLLNILQKMSN